VPDPPWTLDQRLVDGFAFACRPGCGLCCYAAPAVTPTERSRLIQIAPELAWDDPLDAVPARPDGGACRFLTSCRCTVHEARPFPCATFPIGVHLGPRAQASVVLSCPGLSLSGLGRRSDRPGSQTASGLDSELGAVLAELARVGEVERRAIGSDWTRAMRRAGLRPDVAALDRVRATVRSDHLSPSVEDVVATPLPAESDGLEMLPLFFDAEFGRVALADAEGGADVLAIREGGGVGERLASFRRPERIPRTSEEATVLLRGYLDYVLERDATIGATVLEGVAQDPTEVAAEVRRTVAEIGGAVLARSYWRCQLHGRSGESLSEQDVADGIRATDADYLDRATPGHWL